MKRKNVAKKRRLITNPSGTTSNWTKALTEIVELKENSQAAASGPRVESHYEEFKYKQLQEESDHLEHHCRYLEVIYPQEEYAYPRVGSEAKAWYNAEAFQREIREWRMKHIGWRGLSNEKMSLKGCASVDLWSPSFILMGSNSFEFFLWILITLNPW